MPRVKDTVNWTNNAKDLKRHLKIPVSNNSENELLTAWLDAAVQFAEDYLQRDFVPVRVRWLVKPGVAVDDVFELTIGDPVAETSVTRSTTATAASTPSTIAEALRELLTVDLSALEFAVEGYAEAVEVYRRDCLTALTYGNTYTPAAGTSGFTQIVSHDEIPEPVILGVYELVRAWREQQTRPIGLTEVKTGAISEKYAAGSLNDHALGHAAGWWRRYRFARLLAGKA